MIKRIPLFLTIIVFSIYLLSRGPLLSNNPNAAPDSAQQKVVKLYEAGLKSSSFKDNKGKVYSFKSKVPKVVILNFWASWCTPCLEEFPSIVKLQKKYSSNKDFLFLAINTDDEDAIKKLKKVVNKYELNVPIVMDKKGKLVDKFSISAIPVSVIYKDGKVKQISNGSKDFYSEEFLEELKSWGLK